MTHDELCQAVIDSVKQADEQKIIAGFLASFSSRNLAWRSAFGSYVILKHFKPHEYRLSERYRHRCYYCGFDKNFHDVDYSDVLGKYYHHYEIEFALCEVANINQANVTNPTNDDIKIFKSIINAIDNLDKTAQLSELQKSLIGVFKSNKLERKSLLEILGYAGILLPRNQQCYKDDYLPYEFINSTQPSQHYKKEWQYPVRFWTGQDGVNQENLAYYFGKYIND